ncbi:uncharacterized protein Tco025E_07615 [Trypanosoma conorhini]|uniref:Uncharacterized protein n=1 Tax=Trypanosoma conorhini TaxID=83891 RepID=A0A422NLB5_9TRYP|nr:uncharacterized protein Tco025E_07615 [Trypanosoma conorhini]RNF06261.1 hypothetical protein Tco025E_07615 [Trypanosoma conorhini]
MAPRRAALSSSSSLRFSARRVSATRTSAARCCSCSPQASPSARCSARSRSKLRVARPSCTTGWASDALRDERSARMFLRSPLTHRCAASSARYGSVRQCR